MSTSRSFFCGGFPLCVTFIRLAKVLSYFQIVIEICSGTPLRERRTALSPRIPCHPLTSTLTPMLRFAGDLFTDASSQTPIPAFYDRSETILPVLTNSPDTRSPFRRPIASTRITLIARSGAVPLFASNSEHLREKTKPYQRLSNAGYPNSIRCIIHPGFLLTRRIYTTHPGH